MDKVQVIDYQELDNKLETQRDIDSELERSESNEDEDLIADEDKGLDWMEDTPMVVNTQNNAQMVKSPFQKTLNTAMKKNEDSEKIVLNLASDDKKDADYIYTLVYI